MKELNVELSDYEKRILRTMAKLADKGYKEVGDKGLAEFLEDDNPHLFNGYLMRLKKKGLLKYKGWKKNQHVYTIAKRGYILALSIGKAAEQRKLTIEEKTKHLGIPTTEKKTVISPAPSTLETESESSVGGSIGTLQLNVQASHTQKDRKKLEF